MAQSRTAKTAILVLGQGFSTLSVLGLAAVLSRLFTKADYAVYQQTYLSYQFLSPLLLLGLPSALFFFLPRTDDPIEKRRIVIDHLTLITLLGGLFMLVLISLRSLAAWRYDNLDLLKTLPAFAPYALFLFPALSLPAAAVSADRPGVAAIYQGVSRFVMFVITASAAWILHTPLAAVMGTTFSAFVVLPPALYFIFKLFPGLWYKPRWKAMLGQLKYAAPIGIGTVVGVMNLNLDKVIVSSLASKEAFAIYTNGAFEIPILALVASQVGAILQPELARCSKNGNLKAAHAVWSRSITKTSLITFPIMGLCFVFSEELMVFLFSEKYRASANIFRIYLLLLPIRSFQFGGLFAAMNKGRLIVIRSAISLFLNAILTWVLVSKYGALSAAWATVSVVSLFSFPYCLFYSQKWFHVGYKKLIDFSNVAKIAGVVFIASFITYRCKMYLVNFFDLNLAILILGGVIFSTLLLVFALVDSDARISCRYFVNKLRGNLVK